MIKVIESAVTVTKAVTETGVLYTISENNLGLIGHATFNDQDFQTTLKNLAAKPLINSANFHGAICKDHGFWRVSAKDLHRYQGVTEVYLTQAQVDELILMFTSSS